MDLTELQKLHFGYKAITISTIVDFMRWIIARAGYKAITISTIVDLNVPPDSPAPAIKP